MQQGTYMWAKHLRISSWHDTFSGLTVLKKVNSSCYYTVGLLATFHCNGNNYTTGCLALCNTCDDIVVHESCTWESWIPTGHVTTEVSYDSKSVLNNHIATHDSNSCDNRSCENVSRWYHEMLCTRVCSLMHSKYFILAI
jgi:hypothetical protein